ncbi:MAG: hypothetical protein Kow0073_13860 [Immundisolibacter sp.]
MTATHTASHEITALLVLGALLGFAGQWLLRQPLIVAFIVAGIIAGPDVLGVVSDAAHVQVLGGLLAGVALAGARWVVCAIPVHGGSLTHDAPRLAPVDALRNHGYRERIAVAIHQSHDLPA